MKLFANSSHGYQIKERSRHSVTKYLNNEETHAAINNKLFKRLVYVNDQLYEVEMVKSQIENIRAHHCSFFNLQYGKLR